MDIAIFTSEIVERPYHTRRPRGMRSSSGRRLLCCLLAILLLLPTLGPTATAAAGVTATPPAEPQIVTQAAGPMANPDAVSQTSTATVEEPALAPALTVETADDPPVTATTTPVEPVLPSVSPSAEGGCAAEGADGGWLVLDVRVTPAAVTDVMAFSSVGVGLVPVQLPVVLPTVLALGETRWPWLLKPSAVDPVIPASTALLVRVEGMPGDPDANRIAPDSRGGWLLVALPGGDRCGQTPTVTPDAGATASAIPAPTELPESPSTATNELESPISPTAAPASTTSDALLASGLARIAYADGDDVRLRAAPGYDASVLMMVAEGTLVRVVAGDVVASDGSRWYQVVVDDRDGFIVSDYLAPVTVGEADLPAPDATQTTASVFVIAGGDAPPNVMPGEAVAYRYRVTKVDGDPDSREAASIAAVSSDGWDVGVYAADGAAPLHDEDGDGIPETGPLSIGEERVIVVRVTAPADALADAGGWMTVTVFAAGSTAAQPEDGTTGPGGARVTTATIVAESVEITVDTSHVAFGRVSPAGTIDPVVTGVSAVVDERGATYVALDGIVVSVTSNAPWSASCLFRRATLGSDATGPSPGTISWRLSGTDPWTPFGADVDDGECPPDREPGTDLLTYDLQLRVEWSDAPGEVGSEISLNVES